MSNNHPNRSMPRWTCDGFRTVRAETAAEAAAIFASRPPVPAGKVRLAEYGTVPDSEYVVTTVLAAAPLASRPHLQLELQHLTRGWALAGASLRWDEEQFAVRFRHTDGTIHGRRFKPENEADARALFAAWTNQE